MNNTTPQAASYGYIPGSTASDIMSYSDYLMLLFVLNSVVEPVIVVVGVPSNVINCLVFWRQGLRDRMNVCLFTLSSVDLCLLLVSIVFSVGYYLQQGDPVAFGGLYDFLLAFASGVHLGLRTSCGCITMVISVERWVCVVFPLKAASLISARSMAVIMVCIVFVTQICFLTTPSAFVVKSVDNSTPMLVIAFSDFYKKHQTIIDVLESIVMMSIIPLTTFVVTCVATGLTVVKLTAAMTWRKNTSVISSRSQGQHTGLTKMLVLVSCSYILTTTPWVIFYFVTLIVEDFSPEGRYSNLYWASGIVAAYFSVVNSSVSFYIFLKRSRRFRKDVLTLLSCLCHSRHMKTKTYF